MGNVRDLIEALCRKQKVSVARHMLKKSHLPSSEVPLDVKAKLADNKTRDNGKNIAFVSMTQCLNASPLSKTSLNIASLPNSL